MDGFALPAGWGRAELSTPETPPSPCAAPPPGTPGAAVRAYDHTGVMLEWSAGEACAGATAIACDLEHRGRFEGEGAPRLRERPVAIRDWVATEVIAKLLDRPVLAFLLAHGVVESPADGEHTLALAQWNGTGRARVVIATSADGTRVAGFGARVADAPGR